MKNLLLPFVLLFISITTFAQDSQKRVRVKEVGLTFYNLNNFGATYRIGNKDAVWRFNSLFLVGEDGEQTTSNFNSNIILTSNFGYGLNVGRELRKTITEKLDLRLGVDISYNYNVRKEEGFFSDPGSLRETIDQSAGGNLVLGFNYEVAPSIFVGAELLPYLSFNKGRVNSNQRYDNSNGQVYYEQNKEEYNNISTGIRNRSVLISVVYRY